MKQAFIVLLLFTLANSSLLAANKWDMTREEFEKNTFKGTIEPSDFIKYSEEVFDALDRLDTVSTSLNATKSERQLCLKELDAALKKYERLGPGRWADSDPQNIRAKIFNSRILFDLFFMSGDVKNFDEAQKYAADAREAFRTYKEKHRGK